MRSKKSAHYPEKRIPKECCSNANSLHKLPTCFCLQPSNFLINTVRKIILLGRSHRQNLKKKLIKIETLYFFILSCLINYLIGMWYYYTIRKQTFTLTPTLEINTKTKGAIVITFIATHCIVLYCNVLYYTVLYVFFTVLHYNVLYWLLHTVLCSSVLRCDVLYRTNCNVLFCSVLQRAIYFIVQQLYLI